MSFGNPEVAAMAEICEILRALPDEASRLRVMRWSFGRFNAEFKRPDPPVDAPPVPTLVAVPPPAAPPAAAPAPEPSAADIVSEIAAVAPEIVKAFRPRPREVIDFGRQLSELEDLFPAERPRRTADFESF